MRGEPKGEKRPWNVPSTEGLGLGGARTSASNGIKGVSLEDDVIRCCKAHFNPVDVHIWNGKELACRLGKQLLPMLRVDCRIVRERAARCNHVFIEEASLFDQRYLHRASPSSLPFILSCGNLHK